MRAGTLFGAGFAVALISLVTPATAMTQVAPAAAAPPVATHVSMDDAVRLALEHNHQLRADRLGIEAARADETTGALKPNPVFTSTTAEFPVFTPRQLTWNNISNNQTFVQSFTYLFERGGKRDKRTIVAQDATSLAGLTATDSERQVVFQTRLAFINVLFAKSTLALARDNFTNFGTVVDLNRERLRVGDLAESDFLSISLQQLQFQQDVSAAELALLQAKAALRQSTGFEGLAEDFDVDGDLAHVPAPATLEDLKRDALATRPDFLAAQGGVKLANDAHTLEVGNGARGLIAGVEYDRSGPLNGLGFSLSIELPIHDQNQGNIARSAVAIRQATEMESLARTTVLTDVITAFAALQNSEKVLALFESGYLSQAQQSLDTTTYVYQRGGATLLELLDAERTYRTTQLAYRQALAAY
jgi:cobalt-zinc-cadmium efflux system outer membrane protein